MKLSFHELNEFRLRDFFEFADAYAGESNEPQEATQADIDAFYGG
ncbi:hypothetical protein [Paenibacillus senegalensis]|nr:hypothetical protein [Paenibacillus senegalensis]